MPIRFSTQAANADFLVDDAETTGASDGMPSERKPERESRPPEAKGQAKPGKNTHAAGLVKDQDAGKT